MPTKKKAVPKKRAAAKKTAKKSSSKRSTKAKPKKVAKKRPTMMRATGMQCFWVTNGEVLTDLAELRDALGRMDDEVFKYHVNKNRNDFADWVGKVLRERDLAKSLRSSKKPGTAKTVVVRRLRFYGV